MVNYKLTGLGVVVALLVYAGIIADFQGTGGGVNLEAASDAGVAESESADDVAVAEPPTKYSPIGWLIKTSGWIGGCLLLISIYFVTIVIQLFIELRASVVTPEPLLQEWDALLAKRDYQGILIAYGMQRLDVEIQCWLRCIKNDRNAHR